MNALNVVGLSVKKKGCALGSRREGVGLFVGESKTLCVPGNFCMSLTFSLYQGKKKERKQTNASFDCHAGCLTGRMATIHHPGLESAIQSPLDFLLSAGSY